MIPQKRQNKIGNLEVLKTSNKSNIVSAINEIVGETFEKFKNNLDSTLTMNFDEVLKLEYSTIFVVNNGTFTDLKGSPKGAYKWGTLITLISTLTEYANVQIYITDHTGTDVSGVGIYIRGGNGRWLKMNETVVDTET